MRYLFRLAIQIDMPQEVFWNDKACLFLDYYDSYISRKKIEFESKSSEIQFLSWQTGVYVKDSIHATIGNMFGKSKFKYPSMPYGMEDKKPKKQELTDEEVNNKLLHQNYIEMLKWGEFHKGKHHVENSV